MNTSRKGFATIAAIIIALVVAGGVTTGVVMSQKEERKMEKGDGSDQPTYTIPREIEVKDSLVEKPIKPPGFDCKEKLCVESQPLNVAIYQTEFRVDVARYKLTNGTDKAVSIDKLIFTHPNTYTLHSLLSLNFALNVNGQQVGSAPAFVSRGDHYDLTFLKGNGQFDSFMLAPYESVQLELQNSVSPFSTGGKVEIFLSEITGSDDIKFSGKVSGGKIEVLDVVGKSDCQEKFGTMKNPSTGKTQPIRVRLISPNSGTYDQGDKLTIRWETCDLPQDGQLFRAYIGGQIIVSEGPEAVNDGIQEITIPNNLPDGEHHLSIEVLDMYHGGGDYITFDDSTQPLSIGDSEGSAPVEEEEDEGELTEAQKEANARGKMSSFRAAAEVIFDQNHGSYDSVCDSGSISHNLFIEARELLGMSQDNDCKENSAKYRVWIEMVSSNQIFCVDSTGHAELMSRSNLDSSSYACLQ